MYRHGLRIGDVILSVNGHVVDDHQMAINVIDESKDVAYVVYVPGIREADEPFDDLEV